MKDKHKLHLAAAICGVIVIGIYLDNRYNITLADHVLSIATYAIVAALGGNIGLSGIQSWMGGATEDVQTVIQKFDPKDIDGPAE